MRVSGTPLPAVEAVLFDLDGVITPTATVHERAWREVFEEALPHLAEGDDQAYRADDYHRHLDGRPRHEGVRTLLTAHGVDLPIGTPADPPGVDTAWAIGNHKNERFNELLARHGVEPYPDAVAALDRLEEDGVPFALVTSSRNAATVLDAAGLVDRFGVVVDGALAAELGLAGKPAPDPFLEAARRLDVAPAACAVVEDAVGGVAAGRAGGFGLVVGVARDGDLERLADAGAHVVVTDLDALG